MKIIVSQEIEQVCPGFIGAAVEAQVMNTPYCEELWKEIHALGEEYRSTLTTESIKQLSAIEATRRVYKVCGKDPSRYRPAAEALMRRMLQGKELYQIDTLVDLINLASIRFGLSSTFMSSFGITYPISFTETFWLKNLRSSTVYLLSSPMLSSTIGI